VPSAFSCGRLKNYSGFIERRLFICYKEIERCLFSAAQAPPIFLAIDKHRS
jgi:hypothetical protein